MDSNSTEQRGGEPLHRCFFAIRPCDAAGLYLESVIDRLRQHRASVRWVPRQNLHLTLRFLGEISDRQVDEVRSLLRSDGDLASLVLRINGLGGFPSLRAPRVLWAGVQGEHGADTDALMAIQAHTERWARQIGLPPEHRSYSPHITIGRVRMPLRNMTPLMSDLIARECESPYCSIESLVLMRSELTPEGSIYEVLDSRSLSR